MPSRHRFFLLLLLSTLATAATTTPRRHRYVNSPAAVAARFSWAVEPRLHRVEDLSPGTWARLRCEARKVANAGSTLGRWATTRKKKKEPKNLLEAFVLALAARHQQVLPAELRALPLFVEYWAKTATRVPAGHCGFHSDNDEEWRRGQDAAGDDDGDMLTPPLSIITYLAGGGATPTVVTPLTRCRSAAGDALESQTLRQNGSDVFVLRPRPGMQLAFDPRFVHGECNGGNGLSDEEVAARLRDDDGGGGGGSSGDEACTSDGIGHNHEGICSAQLPSQRRSMGKEKEAQPQRLLLVTNLWPGHRAGTARPLGRAGACRRHDIDDSVGGTQESIVEEGEDVSYVLRLRPMRIVAESRNATDEINVSHGEDWSGGNKGRRRGSLTSDAAAEQVRSMRPGRLLRIRLLQGDGGGEEEGAGEALSSSPSPWLDRACSTDNEAHPSILKQMRRIFPRLVSTIED